MNNNTAINQGLSTAQIEEMKAQGYINTPVKPPSKSVGQIIASNTFTYFNLVFTIIAVLLASVGAYRDLTFMGVIFSNTILGIIQELRSKRVLDKLTVLNAPTALVIRNGNEECINTSQLVKNDIVVFKSGDQICADAVVIDGNVSVNESLLTGESDEIKKVVGNELMSGSFVVSGSCTARLEKVGAESYISKLTIKAKQSKKGEQSEIIKSLNRLVKIAGVIIIPIGGFLFYNQYMLGELSVKDNVRASIAAVIGMIPEGLFLLATITLAISAMKLAKDKVLIHDMKCIESLARVDVLCVDKTGTITDENMSVADYYPIDTDIDMLFGLLSDFVSSQSADNITMTALKSYFTKPDGRKTESVSGFSSQYKYSGVNFEKESYVIGAPEFVLKDRYGEFKERIEELGRKGYRVLIFCKYSGIVEGKELTEQVTPYGMITLSNPVRKNAPETFRYFEEQGVDIKVISGDNPVTVCEVAKQAGIKDADKYVDAATLTSDEAIAEAVKNYTVFGRVTPDQKKKIVNALQTIGKTVAMTGDGVNDILAMKEADCSVAMASGSDAAAQSAQLVLLESDFSKMPSIVHEGRRVVNNLERSGSLYIVKNIFSCLIAVLAIFFSFSYPLKPAQISMIGMFTIGLPSFLLSQAPNTDIIKGNFLKNVLMKALPGGLADTIIVIAMVYFGSFVETSNADIQTASTILLGVIGLMVVFNIAKPMDKYKWGVFGICTLGLIVALLFFKNLFDLTPLSLAGLLLCINFSIMGEPFYRYLRKLFEWFESIFETEDRKKLKVKSSD